MSYSFSSNVSFDNNNNNSQNIINSSIKNISLKPNKTNKYDQYTTKKFFFILFLIGIGIGIISIIFLLFMRYKKNMMMMMMKKDIYKYKYKYMMVYRYNNNKENETVEMMIEKDIMVRGFGFGDDDGNNGYIYQINDDKKEEEEEEEVYYVEGECSCCVECLGDENCNDEKIPFCVENVCVECKDDGNCENLVCDHNGKCSNEKEQDDYCRNNNDCMGVDEICNSDGECTMIGCKSDNDCQNDEKCIGFHCNSNGCNDNFDCNDYDHVCINNECIEITESTESCLSDEDCSYNDFYCDYEYLMCVKMENYDVSRRKIEVVPAVCTVYGVISLFFMMTATTYIKNQENIARDKLIEECNGKCSNVYYSTSNAEKSKQYHDRISKVKSKKYSERKKGRNLSDCSGNCKGAKNLKNTLEIEKGAAYCGSIAPYRAIISAKEKEEFLSVRKNARRVFWARLSRYCKLNSFTYEMKAYNLGKNIYAISKCVAEPESIKCTDSDG